MTTSSPDRLLVVGNPDEVHLGSHVYRAAASLGLAARICDSTLAFAAPVWRQKMEWWARGRRPARLREFSAAVVDAVQAWRPRYLIATGISPIDQSALATIGVLGTTRINVLTDDPWNPAHRAPWFMDALPLYDHVFSPRRLNLPDLAALCGRPAAYLPFAYAPDVHFPQAAVTEADRLRFEAEVMLAGGADADRVRIVREFIRAGLHVAVYGGYWERFPETRPHWRGMLDAAGLRMATSGAQVCLCLVRRANRDGHSMRSFEVPAMRGCVLAEDTEDHRALFGGDGTAAALFRTVDEAIDHTRALLGDDDRRLRLAGAAHQRVTTGGHTYRDRLAEIVRVTADVQDVSPAMPMGAQQ